MSTAAGVNSNLELALEVVNLVNRLKDHVPHHPRTDIQKTITVLVRGKQRDVHFIIVDDDERFCMTSQGLVRRPSRKGEPVPVLSDEHIRKLSHATQASLRDSLRVHVKGDVKVFGHKV